MIFDILDTEANILTSEEVSAGCVRKSDDSKNSAIRIAYRISLRSSSSWEPRYPSLKIFLVFKSLVILDLKNRCKESAAIENYCKHLTEHVLGFGLC